MRESEPTPAPAVSLKRPRGGSAPGRRYDSAVMQDRRARILAEAQGLLSEVGLEGFTINELSVRAGVAQRTLYRNLGPREEIIARAISAHYDSLLSTIPPFKGRTLQHYLDRAIVLARFVIALRSYATAMMTVFFSPTIDRRIYARLQAIPLKGYGNFVQDAVDAGLFHPLNEGERELLTHRFPHVSYGLVSDWVAGRIDDEGYIDRAPTTFLLATYPFMQPAARAEADVVIAQHAAALLPHVGD